MKWTADNKYVRDETEISPGHFHIVADCDSVATAKEIAAIHNIHEETVSILKEFDKGYAYAQLTDEAHLNLNLVLDLIGKQITPDFHRGYRTYCEELH